MARDLSAIKGSSRCSWTPLSTSWSARPSGAKEGVLCAWGISETGERVLLLVMLGMRELEDDWTALGRDLTGRGARGARS